MWAMLQGAGAVLAKFGAKNPAVKWGVIALVGLFAVEFLAERFLDLYTRFATVQPTIDQKNADAVKAVNDAKTSNLRTNVDTSTLRTAEQADKIICDTPKLRERFPDVACN